MNKIIKFFLYVVAAAIGIWMLLTLKLRTYNFNKFIEYNYGCGGDAFPGCFGPRVGYYTILGTPQNDFLTFHFTPALIAGILLFLILFFLKKKGKIKASLLLRFLITITFIVLSALVLTLIFPVIIMY